MKLFCFPSNIEDDILALGESDRAPLDPSTLGTGQIVERERVLLRGDGTLLNVHIRAMPLSDGNIMVVMKDLTDIRARDEAIGIRALFGLRSFERRVDGGKEHHGAHSNRSRLTDFVDQAFEAPAPATGHRIDVFVDLLVVEKKRQDEIVGVQHGLTHQATDGSAAAIATGADGEVHR